jgi:hypothetical protein
MRLTKLLIAILFFLLLWWPGAFSSQPWRTWFWATRPGTTATYSPYTEWAAGYYWFYKIPAEGGHREQLAFRSPEDRRSTGWGQRLVKANVIYIVTYVTDTPNWGNVSQFIDIGPPCGNWRSAMFEEGETTRSQTYSLLAAAQSNRELPIGIDAAVAKTEELAPGVTATIQATPELPITTQAAIAGNPELAHPVRAAIRAELLLEPGIIAAIGKDFSLVPGVTATVQGNPYQWYGTRAAIKGETEKSVGITAFVVKSRATQIMLEMENLWPQEMDLRSTPNSPSEWRDWRKHQLGQ